ncbi:MAG: homoserine kinase [Oligoflexales bacterium]|nr:homoserine kinase [Oligoflexales bacterium]
MEKIRIFAPATIGNVGPGFDVIGLCVDGLGDTVTVSKTDGKTEITDVRGTDASSVPLDPAKNTVTIAASAFFAATNKNINLKVEIERHLPCSGGLGSSAASSLAGAMAAAYFGGEFENTDLILQAALEGEGAVSGRHLDNIAPCYNGGVTIVQSTKPTNILSVPLNREWWLTLFISDFKLSTKEARSVLPDMVDRATFVKQLANSASLILGFTEGNEEILRVALNDHFAEPRRAPLIPQFHDLKKAALDSGALGSSISGAGPTIFALSESRQIASEVAEAMLGVYKGKARTHIGLISKTGARLL